jgi:flagellar export protein FliJ
MPKFSLQRVLELRERKEQAVAARLTAARSDAEAARASAAEFETLRERGGAQRMAAQRTTATVGQLQNATYVLERLDQQLAAARAAARIADAQVDACQAEFTVASQERRILDRLKERRIESAIAEEIQEDRRTMDGVAVIRFARRAADTGGEP